MTGLFDTGLDMENPLDEETRKELLKKALESVNAGDMGKALELFHQRHSLLGLVRRLRAKWGKLSDDDIHDALSQAIVRLLEKVLEGKQVLRPIPYLIRVSDGFANNIWRSSDYFSETEIDKLRDDGQTSFSTSPDSEELRKQALTIAKGFLPQLGQENVRSVMEYIFDAMERGIEDVSNLEIGEALALSPDVVRQSKTRGWKRLERIAKDNGYHVDMNFMQTDLENEEGDIYE